MRYLAQRWQMISTVLLVASLSSCRSAPPTVGMPRPMRSSELGITWHDDGERVSLSREDAVRLAQWLIDVDFYIYG